MNFISHLFNQAVDVYNVNPIFYICLYLITIPIYYFGEYLMIKSGYQYYKREYVRTKKIDITKLISEEGFIKGLVINRFGWVAPYFYIFIFGKNLPWWLYVLVVVWLFVTTFLIIWKTGNKAYKKTIIYKEARGEEILKARNFLFNRYVEVGYLSENQKDVIQKDKFNRYSKYFIAKEQDKIVGVIRIINNSELGLPVINNFDIKNKVSRRLYKEGERVVEIGSLAALPGQKIAKGLYRMVISYCIKNKKITVACIDENLFNRLKIKYWPLSLFLIRIGGTKYYLGSLTVPIKLKFYRFMLLFI